MAFCQYVNVVPPLGFAPRTCCSSGNRSTTELQRHIVVEVPTRFELVWNGFAVRCVAIPPRYHMWSQTQVTLLTSHPYERSLSTCSFAINGTPSRTWTHIFFVRTEVPYPIGPSEHGSESGIRTHTGTGLSRFPLPVGIPHHWWGQWDLNPHSLSETAS